MTASPRPVPELPGDPSRLRLVYTHDHSAEPYDFEDTLEWWHVSVRLFHAEEEECPHGCSEACERATEEGTEIGYLHLCRLRDYTADNRWEAADAESGDLESIVSTVLDPRTGHYTDAFDEAIECPVGDLLILDRVFLDKPWRGFGLGPILAAETIRRLSGGCCAVAAEPGMAEWPDNQEEVSESYRQQARRKIAALWESIGFTPFRNGVYLLDPALRQPGELLTQKRNELLQLAQAYRSQATALTTLPEPEPEPTPAAARGGRAVSRQLPAREDWLETIGSVRAQDTLLYLQGRCQQAGWDSGDKRTALALAAEVTSETDLRELGAQIQDVHFGLHKAFADAITFSADSFDVGPFRADPSRLGPLAGVWVYGSNLHGRYTGRSHGVGDACQHARLLSARLERISLAQLLSLEDFWQWNGPMCSFCSGWSGQRLTEEQYTHYLSVRANNSPRTAAP
jgi:GNAT superfamily N-acetyltransferase